MRLNLETSILPLLESAGRILAGQTTLDEIKNWRKHLTTGITLIDLCAKSSGMEATTEANPKPSQSNLNFQNLLSVTSNPNIFELSLRIYDGKDGLMLSYEKPDIWFRSLVASDGSLDDVTIPLPSGKRLHMTLKEVSPISSTEQCFVFGDGLSLPDDRFDSR